MENVGAGNLSMPEQEMHTTAFWLHFPEPRSWRAFGTDSTEKQNGLVGLANVLRTVASLLLHVRSARSRRRAHRRYLTKRLTTFEPNLYLYDNYPGGIGQSQPLFALCKRLLTGAMDVLTACLCQDGCPACVGPIGEVGERGKQSALRILSELLA